MTAQRTQRGFTLIEIMVVIGIIGLVMLIVLPSIGKLFASEADSQARNLLDAQLKAARSLAVRDRLYTGLHFQRHHETGEYWVAILQQTAEDPSASANSNAWVERNSVHADVPRSGEFAMRLAPGTQPAKLPAGIGVGLVHAGLDDDYSKLEDWDTAPPNTAPLDRTPFTTFTVLFDPDGRLVTPGAKPFVRDWGGNLYCARVFSDDADDVDLRIWELPRYDDVYVKAVCLFDSGLYDTLRYDSATSGTEVSKEEYLDENAQFLPVAPYVGGLIRTAVE